MLDKSEFILLAGSMVLFSMLLLNVNSFLVQNNVVNVRSELNYTAISLAQNIIDEAENKAFDETTVGTAKPSSIPSGFSSILGPDGGETIQNFNDFDDYNGYNVTKALKIGTFSVSVTVNYVDSTNYQQPVSYQTRHKLMKVVVTNAVMKNPVYLTFVKSYY